MNNNISKLLVTALVTGFIAGNVVIADDAADAAKTGDVKAGEKGCNGKKCGNEKKHEKNHKKHGKKKAEGDAGAKAPTDKPADAPPAN